MGPSARSILLAAVAASGLAAFLTIRPEQPWILWLSVGLVGLGVDGTVRSNPSWQRGMANAVVYLFLPVLATLAAGLFIDEAMDGYARPIAGVCAGIGVGVTAFGEYHTVSFGTRLYGTMRLILAIATYLTAFGLFTVMFTREIELPLAAAGVGLVSLMLAIELLRESRLTGRSSILAGIAIGVSLAELRVVLYFFPLDGLLAGALLIIGFYLATGISHHLLDEDLEVATLAEYLIVASVSAAAVVLARAYV